MDINELKQMEQQLVAFREELQERAEELTTHKDLREHLAGESLSDAADFIHRAARYLQVEEEQKEFNNST